MAGAALAIRPVSREDVAAALKTFFRIAEQWGLNTEEQLVLLGSPARSTLFKWRKEGGLPPKDTVERISYLLGIYKALRILFTDDAAAHGWVKKPNKSPMFGGKSALEFLLNGDVADLYRVRSYLDTQRGGWS